MSDLALYSEIESKIEGRREEEDDYILIPSSITSNLKHNLREYQVKALENFIYYFEKNKRYKAIDYKHLLFHMATGSGKTNIIASTILYLYSKGYRDFIFFVNTTNIITKTKDNIINKYSSKYLFKEKIIIDNQEVSINEITDTFDVSKKDDINIMFTTIHKLHGDLENLIKENSITYNDFDNRKIVLLADEAHHIKEEKEWGQTTRKILNRNKDNVLLEFTATAEFHNNAQRQKEYINKHIAEYPLKLFREDRYSKEIKLINDNFTNSQRMLQALMVSEYRKIVAKEHLDKVIKPVVMFKNPKGIAKVNANFEDFKKLIENLKPKDIEEIFNISDIKAIQDLKEFIKDDIDSFAIRLQRAFNVNSCMVVYSTQADKEEKLKLLNSLEKLDNPIRVIFAVNVLNEGWDVLNLFDIVKLDEAKKGGASTTSEAQLIGRGARYYPFDYKDEDRYKRKFDVDFTSPLKLLEEMYFYSINKSDYITGLKKELGRIGLLESEGEVQEVTLKLKDSFVNHDLYKSGVVYVNAKVPQDKTKINSISDYIGASYKIQNISIDNSSKELKIFDEEVEESKFLKPDTFKLKDIDADTVRLAINKKPFFYFNSLKKYFKNLKSIKEFISSDDYLGGVEFSVRFTKVQGINISLQVNLILELLEVIEKGIIKNATEFVGSSEFYPVRISERIPKSKTLKLKESDSTIDIPYDWYVFQSHGGTSEERAFTDFILKMTDILESKYKDIKLIRNEKAFIIHSFDKFRNGAKFEPDFLLLLKDDECFYQIFCEPKGDWTKDQVEGFENSPEKWKNEFLKAITEFTKTNKITLEDINKQNLKLYENSCYKLYGLPFYNQEMESEFREEFVKTLL